MSNLIIDEGNTLCKFAIAEDGKIVSQMSSASICDDAAVQFIRKHDVDKIISSSTRSESVELPQFLRSLPHLALTPQAELPIKIDYATPQTLGCDRIAAAVGARTIYPSSNVLIIDIGTAMTIDFLASDGVYCGGIISLGPEIRAKALNHFTGRLPLVGFDGEVAIQGKSTAEAIRSGIVNGISFEIEGYINRYRRMYDDLKIVITGGGANMFFKDNAEVVHNPDLVLLGMNNILDNWKH